jgi:hypothetical protein
MEKIVIPDAPAKIHQLGTWARSGTHCEIWRVVKWVPGLRVLRFATNTPPGMTAV